MIEVYKNTAEYVPFTTWVAGTPAVFDEDVVVELRDHKSGELLATANAENDNFGSYRYLVPLEFTEEDRELSVTWLFTHDGRPGSRTDLVKVVTPYVYPEQVYEAWPQLSDKTWEEIKGMERQVRAAINAYTGQDFGSSTDTITVTGTGSDLLRLTRRAYQIDSVSVNGQALNLGAGGVDFTDTNYAFRPFPFGPYYDVKPDLFFYAGRPYFRRNVKYTVTGKFGWENVPSDINLAAKMLIGDYFCSDSGWRKKGITRVRAADWAFDFGTRAFQGTGNVDVDNILEQYQVINMVVI